MDIVDLLWQQTAEAGEGCVQVPAVTRLWSLATEQSVCSGQGAGRNGQGAGEEGTTWFLSLLFPKEFRDLCESLSHTQRSDYSLPLSQFVTS